MHAMPLLSSTWSKNKGDACRKGKSQLDTRPTASAQASVPSLPLPKPGTNQAPICKLCPTASRLPEAGKALCCHANTRLCCPSARKHPPNPAQPTAEPAKLDRWQARAGKGRQGQASSAPICRGHTALPACAPTTRAMLSPQVVTRKCNSTRSATNQSCCARKPGCPPTETHWCCDAVSRSVLYTHAQV